MPNSEEVTTQSGRMLAREDLHIGIVVEQCALRPPSNEHGLVRPQHDPDEGFEALRPPLGRANRRRGPVVRTHEGAHLPATREKVQPFAWLRPAVHTVLFPCSRRSGLSQLHALGSRSVPPAPDLSDRMLYRLQQCLARGEAPAEVVPSKNVDGGMNTPPELRDMPAIRRRAFAGSAPHASPHGASSRALSGTLR